MPHQPQDPGRKLVSEFHNDPDMLELIELFVEELPARVEVISQALAQRDHDKLLRLTHQLKGAGAGYGFPTISAAAAAVEHTIRVLGADAFTERPTVLAQQVQSLVHLCERACAKAA